MTGDDHPNFRPEYDAAFADGFSVVMRQHKAAAVRDGEAAGKAAAKAAIAAGKAAAETADGVMPVAGDTIRCLRPAPDSFDCPVMVVDSWQFDSSGSWSVTGRDQNGDLWTIPRNEFCRGWEIVA